MLKKIAGLLAVLVVPLALYGIAAVFMTAPMNQKKVAAGFTIDVPAVIFEEVPPSALEKLISKQYDIEAEHGTRQQVQACKRYLRLFNLAAHHASLPDVTVSPERLLGIATVESGNCSTELLGGSANVMQITLADDHHLKRAAVLLGVKPRELDWERNMQHSVMLGAVMYADYYQQLERQGDTTPGIHALEAYNQGPDDVDTKPDVGNEYILRVLAAERMAGEQEVAEDEEDGDDPFMVAIDDRI